MSEKRRSIVAGNWKMHGSRRFVADYVRELARRQEPPPEADFVLFPPTVYLAPLADALADAELAGRVQVGAQNLHAEQQGAYTGEVAGEMIRDLGERRGRGRQGGGSAARRAHAGALRRRNGGRA